MLQPQRYRLAAIAVIATTTLFALIPFIKFGIPSGHDFEFHMNSWIEVVDHWKQGNLYPHWAALAHYGYGEARFIFYPPLSWTLGALLGLILPWKLVPAAYIWFVLTLAGCSMFLLVRRWLAPSDAMLAAVFYAINPYNLVIVYWRSAFAELMAGIYLPLLLLLILRAEEDGKRSIVPLSLVMAAGWLTNLPSAVMMNYSLAILAIAVAIQRRSTAIVGYTAAAAVLGAMLAGFYLLPAFHQRSWVNIGEVIGPGLHPLDNFLFTRTEDADHNRFNLLVSIVAASEIVIVIPLLISWRRSHRNKVCLLAAVWSLLCIAFMLRPTLPLWNHLPELRFVQFPWRWLLCLNVPLALAIVFGIRRGWVRVLLCAAALSVVPVVWHRVQAPWWDNTADIKEMLDNQHDAIGNEGADEYVPAGADPYDIDQKAPVVRYEGRGAARIDTQQWFAEERRLSVVAPASGTLVMRLFNYPSWKVRVNGKPVAAAATPHTHQLTVPVQPGKNEVQISFVEGWDRWAGLVSSAIALLAGVLLFASSRNRQLVFDELNAR